MSQPPVGPNPYQPGAQPQPGFPPAPQPGFPPAAPQKKSNVGKILLIILAAVLLLCVGGSAIVFFAFKDDVKEAVEAVNTRVVEPETLGGRNKVTDPELQALAVEMVADIKQSVPNSTSTVGGFYGDIEKQDLVMIVGASGIIADPAKELDDAAKGVSTELGVTNMASIDPGPLGGTAKCGDGTTEEIPVGVCVWADKGSVGMIAIYFKSAKETQAEFLAIRAAVEKRS